MNTSKTIVTHNGQFHADEVMACAIALRRWPDASVVRTRDPAITCGGEGRVVLDVGGVFDVFGMQLDHHQRGHAEQWSDGIEMSSAGLAWSYIEEMERGPVWEAVRDRLIKPIDATDNGQLMMVNPPIAAYPGIVPMSLSAVLASFNSLGEEKGFIVALKCAQGLLEAAILGAQEEARTSSILELTILTHAGKEILVLPEFCPNWAKRLETEPSFMYVLFPGSDGMWMCQAVAGLVKFSKRRPLPAQWGGIRDAALIEMTGVPDAVFCHPGLFICGAKSREGALALAYLALGIGRPSDLEDR